MREGLAGLVGATMRALPEQLRMVFVEQAPFVGRMDYQPRAISLHVNSDIEYSVRLHSVRQEPGTVEWMQKSLRPGDILFDIGANVGAYTLIAARYFDGKVRVVSFEPSALNFAQLVRNLALNQCLDHVTALPVALSNATRVSSFSYQNASTGGALHTLEEPGAAARSFVPLFRQDLLAYRLDDLILEFGLPQPTHIKIDVDGTEADVLAGATATLRQATLRSVLIEVAATQLVAVKAALETAGFELAARDRLEGDVENLVFNRGPA